MVNPVYNRLNQNLQNLRIDRIKAFSFNSNSPPVFRLTTVTTRIVYKIRGSSFLKKNLNLEWIKNVNYKDCI